MTIPTIVCATDLGPSGDRAVALASLWATATGSRLEVMHVTDAADEIGLEAVPMEMKPAAAGFRKRLLERKQALHDRLITSEARCLAKGLECRATILEGRPWEALLQEAERLEATGLVVGPHASGRGLLGTTAGRVVRHAHCPVFVASGKNPMPERMEKATWLVGVDFAEESRMAVEHVGRIIGKMGGRLVLHHALTPLINEIGNHPVGWEALVDGWRSDARDRLKALVHQAGLSDVTLRVTQGNPAREIDKVALEVDASFIAVGTHGRTGLSRAAFGSQAERLVRQAPVPVLVVRPIAGETES